MFRCPQRPEKSIGSHGAVVTVMSGPVWVLGTELWSSAMQCVLKHWAVSPAHPQICVSTVVGDTTSAGKSVLKWKIGLQNTIKTLDQTTKQNLVHDKITLNMLFLLLLLLCGSWDCDAVDEAGILVRCNSSDVRLLFPRISRCLLSGHSQMLVLLGDSPGLTWQVFPLGCAGTTTRLSQLRGWLASTVTSICVWNQSLSLFSRLCRHSEPHVKGSGG